MQTPFRYDYVGSFLRPERLKEARKAYVDGDISYKKLRQVEDEEITKLVKKQKELGYHVITDGEFRRSYWHLDFMWGLHGIQHVELEHGYMFKGEETTKGSAIVYQKISGENHPFVEDYKFVKQFEDEKTIAKQTLPAPSQLLAELFRGDNAKITKAIYTDQEVLCKDIANAYHTVFMDLYNAGCRNIQMDDCTWGMLVDKEYWNKRVGKDHSIKDQATLYLTVNNMALENLPSDLVVNTHICRGNYHSTYATSGPYDEVAGYVFAKENVNTLYLEFDDERSGSFAPLAKVSKDKKVVLGLITTKHAALEDEDYLIKRIEEASKYIDLDRICISPQCGFASCEIGNKLNEQQQWAKLELVKRVAKKVWK